MGIGAEGRKAEEAQRPTLAEAREAATADPGPANDKSGADGVKPTHSFDLAYTDSRKRLWTGSFRCHVLTLREKVAVGLVKSRLSNGVAPHMLDVTTSNLLEMLSHLAVALDETPDWARGDALEGFYDPGVVSAIYSEVADHEARFHGTAIGNAGESVGDGPGASA